MSRQIFTTTPDLLSYKCDLLTSPVTPERTFEDEWETSGEVYGNRDSPQRDEKGVPLN